MSSENHEKIEELLSKVKSLGQRVRSTRDSLGEPVLSRVFDRLNKLSNRLPVGNGDRSQPPVQAQEPRVVCPRCGKIYLETFAFCSGCGFSFQEVQRKQAREQLERENLERTSGIGVVP